MKLIQISQNTDEWLEFRKGKITGSKLKDIVSLRGKNKIGYYQLIADRLAIEPDLEDPRERGHRLEEEAIERFSKESKKEVEIGLTCVSDFNPNIMVSPDGLIGKDDIYHEAVEIKCLSDARHIEAVLSETYPDAYHFQILQYFIVIETLQKLSLVFYTDRIPSADYKVFEVTREELLPLIETYKEMEEKYLREIDEIVTKLAF